MQGCEGWTLHDYFPSRKMRKKGVPNLFGVNALHLAVLSDDKRNIERILTDENIDSVCGEPHLLSSLELAALFKQKELIQLLIERGAQLPEKSTETKNERRPMSNEMAFNREEAAQALLQILRNWDEKGNTFLHIYCDEGVSRNGLEMVENLVAFGMDANALNNVKKTPFHCLSGQCSTVFDTKKLRRLGANLSIQDKEGNTPLMTALINDGSDIVIQQLIPNLSAINLLNDDGYSALALSVEHSSPEVMSLLLERVADVEWIGKDGKSLLQLAVDLFHPKYTTSSLETCFRNRLHPDASLVKYCLLYRPLKYIVVVDIEWLNVAEDCPDILHVLVKGGFASSPFFWIFAMIDVFDANVNALRRDGQPLVSTLIKHSAPVELLEYLFEKGLSVYEETSDEHHLFSFLQLAALFKRKDMIHLLIKMWARIPEKPSKVSNKRRKKCDKMARKRDEASRVLLKILNNWDEKGNTFLHVYGKSIHVIVLSNLVDFGMDINALNDNQESPLHLVSIDQSESIDQSDIYECNALQERLLRLGANLCIQEKDGNTPLMTALVNWRSYSSIELLVPDKSGLNLLNNKGYSAVALSLKYYQRKVLNLLLKRGADIKWLGNDGKSLLHLAADISQTRQSKFSLSLLMKRGLHPNASFIRHCLLNYPLYVNHVLENTKILNVTKNFPDILHLMIPFNWHWMAKMIEVFDADVNALGSDGQSLATTISKCGHLMASTLRYLLSQGLTINAENSRSALVGSNVPLFVYVMKRRLPFNFKESIPNGLILLTQRIGYKENQFFPLMARLIEEFRFDPNDCFEDGYFLIQLINHIDSNPSVDKCVDYLLKLPEIDVDLNVCFNNQTPFSVAFNRRHYRIALKLLRNGADSSIAEIDYGIGVNGEGLTDLLVAMFYSGHQFPPNSLGWYPTSKFSEWLNTKNKILFPLKRLAGNVVRKVLGRKVIQLLVENDFPGDVKEILLLNNIVYRLLD